MDQLGNTERTTEEPASEDRQPEGMAGGTDAPRTACSLAVFRAELDASEPAGPTGTAGTAESEPGTESADHPVPDKGPASAEGPTLSGHTEAADHPVPEAGSSNPGVTPNEDTEDIPTPDDTDTASTEHEGAGRVGPDEEGAGGFPDGFTGTLALQNLEAFDEQMVGDALSRMGHLMSWMQALQARLMVRMLEIFRDSFHAASGRLEPGMAFSLAASECAAILNIPQVTAQRMMFEALNLCSTHTATLTGLEEGKLSYQHAQVVLDQCQNVPAEKLPGFEADLLAAADGQTRAQFACKARRLRERTFPETISKRHLTAFEQRKVTLDREEDGMSCLSAHLRAAEAQQIYTTLSTAARGEQAAGDSRSTDQLRADILAQLLMGGLSSTLAGDARSAGLAGSVAGGGPTRVGRTGPAGGAAGRGSTRVGDAAGPGSRHAGDAGGDGSSCDDEVGDAGGTAGAGGTGCDEAGVVPRAEIMVLITAETLFGADNQPAELHGYGPISAEAARRLARNAAGWTGLAQNPQTGEILGVGRRRKVPAGLRRWLRARDGTCRFPGCRVSTANSDIDHTTDWAKGGPTDHGNLEHLCRRHHRFKTLGYWKASQPTPGVIEWTSPTGRVYRTEPFLELGRPKLGPPDTPQDTPPDPVTEHGQEAAAPF